MKIHIYGLLLGLLLAVASGCSTKQNEQNHYRRRSCAGYGLE